MDAQPNALDRNSAGSESGARDAAALREALKGAVKAQDGIATLRALHGLCDGAAKPTDYAFAARQLGALNPEARKAAGTRTLRAWIARTVTVEPLIPQLVVEAALKKVWLEIEIGSYGGFIDELMNPAGPLAVRAPDLVLLLIDAADVAAELPGVCAGADPSASGEAAERVAADLCGMVKTMRGFSNAKLVVQGLLLEDRPALGALADANNGLGHNAALAQINRTLAAQCAKMGDALYFDLDHLAAHHGRGRWRDARMVDSTGLAVAHEHFVHYTRGLARNIAALVHPPRKVFCTDLDNTFWGGIVGEDGPEGIALGHAFPGRSYQRYQEALKHLAQRGILLAIVSKNNPGDVEEAFKLRSADLTLQLEDFVARRVGWGPNNEAIAAMAGELSLGLDAFVFADDSPVECAEMRERLPQVEVVQLSADEPWLHAQQVEELTCFDVLKITDDDRKRANDYRAQSSRAQLEAAAGSREDFLASLEIVCTPVPALDAPLTRTVQLLNKTNQFNLTTRRHSELAVRELVGGPAGIGIALRVRDRFGDSGIVGLALAKCEGDVCTVDSLLLSCRVIGRGIETALLGLVAIEARRHGALRMQGAYIATPRNGLCADFYDRHQFARIAASVNLPQEFAAQWFESDLSNPALEIPAWIELNEKVAAS